MFLKQFYLPSLGHASYLVGSEETGEALVLDLRQRAEWCDGHARGELHVTGGELTRQGHREAVNVLGGMTAWEARGYPMERER